MHGDAYAAAAAYTLRRRLQADALLERAAVLMNEGRGDEAELILAQREDIMRGRDHGRVRAARGADSVRASARR